MEVKGLRFYPESETGSIDTGKLSAFLSQFSSLNSGKIYFTIKERVTHNGVTEQCLVLKRESASLLQ